MPHKITQFVNKLVWCGRSKSLRGVSFLRIAAQHISAIIRQNHVDFLNGLEVYHLSICFVTPLHNLSKVMWHWQCWCFSPFLYFVICFIVNNQLISTRKSQLIWDWYQKIPVFLLWNFGSLFVIIVCFQCPWICGQNNTTDRSQFWSMVHVPTE